MIINNNEIETLNKMFWGETEDQCLLYEMLKNIKENLTTSGESLTIEYLGTNKYYKQTLHMMKNDDFIEIFLNIFKTMYLK
jgi:hypothetical protein